MCSHVLFDVLLSCVCLICVSDGCLFCGRFAQRSGEGAESAVLRARVAVARRKLVLALAHLNHVTSSLSFFRSFFCLFLFSFSSCLFFSFLFSSLSLSLLFSSFLFSFSSFLFSSFLFSSSFCSLSLSFLFFLSSFFLSFCVCSLSHEKTRFQILRKVQNAETSDSFEFDVGCVKRKSSESLRILYSSHCQLIWSQNLCKISLSFSFLSFCGFNFAKMRNGGKSSLFEFDVVVSNANDVD
jgi:hypothetical protein